MKRAASLAGLLVWFATACGAPAAEADTEDPIIAQRRLAMALRQATQHYEAKEYQAALDRLAHLPEPLSKDLSVLNLQGAVFIKTGRYDEARQTFLAILSVDPGYFPAAFNLGEIQFVQGDYGKALETFQIIRRNDPRNELVRFKTILCLLLLDRDEEAKKLTAGLVPAGGTPAWYYSQAMIAQKAGDRKAAEKHLAAARAIYQNDGCAIFDESIQTVDF